MHYLHTSVSVAKQQLAQVYEYADAVVEKIRMCHSRVLEPEEGGRRGGGGAHYRDIGCAKFVLSSLFILNKFLKW
jgi:molybdenum-dependent DNA-binding transcriptional regulator ModE